MHVRAVAAALLVAGVLSAEDGLTIYELLAPNTHKFLITYDVSTAVEGARFYLNPIRRGSRVSGESVIDLATGKPLEWENIDGKTARESGLLSRDVPDDSLFLNVRLAYPVPKDGQARLRIIKTYEDAASYQGDEKQITFERRLGIRRNVVVLPPGYELIESSVAAIVDTQADGRIRVSALNDRDDELPLKIRGRKLP